jgi:hypothetical protein
MSIASCRISLSLLCIETGNAAFKNGMVIKLDAITKVSNIIVNFFDGISLPPINPFQ